MTAKAPISSSAASLPIIRALALALPETAEASHMGTPDFRVRGKIFATARDDGPRAVLKLPLHIQAVLIETQPEAFSLTAGWGKHGWTFVETDKIDADLLRDLLDLAWRQVAPKKLILQDTRRPSGPIRDPE